MVTVDRYALPAVISPKSEVETVQGDCDESVREVSVLVVAFQISEATSAIDVSVLELYPHTALGNVAKSDDEALVTVVLTEAVPAVTADPRDEEAVPTMLLVLLFTAVVPAVIAEAIDEEAVVTSD